MLLGAGFAVLWSERLPAYLYFDGEIGRSNFGSHNIAGGVRFSFLPFAVAPPTVA